MKRRDRKKRRKEKKRRKRDMGGTRVWWRNKGRGK
jgi:hypothetical protein